MTNKSFRNFATSVGACLVLFGFSQFSHAQEEGLKEFPKLSIKTDWPWWRGPQRNGIGDDQPVPTKISETENVVWKVAVPGRGHSSPTVVGDRVFLTTADEKQQIHSVLAFDRTTGKQLWQTEVNRGGFPAKNHPKNTEATPTVACDGERVFATFYNHDSVEFVALNLDGKVQWKHSAGAFHPKTYEYGYAPSPLIYRNSVIIAAEYDGPGFLAGFDRQKGTQLWKINRPKGITFSSPVVAPISNTDELLISGSELVAAYDPKDGKALWTTRGTTNATCGSMVWDKDIVFASGGYPKAETVAVRADGSGKVLWKNTQKCYEQSMLAYQGHLYALTDNGVMFCWRGTDGKEMWKQRLSGPVSASPVLAGGHIYQANELGTLYVLRPDPKQFELVAENKVGNESFASPAICGGQIFLRVAERNDNQRQEFLYCFSSKK